MPAFPWMKGTGSAISLVASATVLSRVLGMLRDMCLFALLGSGTLSSAFVMALTIPNLFRRLLGEGALSSSTLPVLSEARHHKGDPAANRILNGVVLWLVKISLWTVILGYFIFWALSQTSGWEPRWYYAIHFSYILFPYVGLVCVGAILCGALNVLGRFTLAALNGVWLNLCILLFGLVGLGFTSEEGLASGRLLAFGVLIGGLFQLGVPAWGLYRLGWSPRRGVDSDTVRAKVLPIFWPAVFGAAVFQINILISRGLGFWLDESGASLLYLSARLVELPLGVFAISIVTVLFPKLSEAFASGNSERFNENLWDGIRSIWWISLPAMTGALLLAEPIIRLLFQWGSFDEDSVYRATPIVQVALLGLPFYGLTSLYTRAFHARQDTRTTARLAVVALTSNLVLSFSLMVPMGVTGLALANVLSGAVHLGSLIYCLGQHIPPKGWIRDLGFPVLGCGGMAGLLILISRWLEQVEEVAGNAKLYSAIELALLVPTGILFYTGLLFLLGHRIRF